MAFSQLIKHRRKNVNTSKPTAHYPCGSSAIIGLEAAWNMRVGGACI